MSYSLHVQQILNKYSSDSKAHLRLATGGYQGEVFLKIVSGEPRQRAWEEVREAREVAFIFSLFITCNLDGFSVSGERWSNLLSGGHITYHSILPVLKISHMFTRSMFISFNISIAMHTSCLFSGPHWYC